MEKYQNQHCELYQADCIDFLKNLPDNSIDLIATDPPYFRVKNEGWDKQWTSKADFLTWLHSVLNEYERVLKPTGSLYLFASPYLAASIECAIAEHFTMLNHIIWRKPTGRHQGCRKETLRKYFPQTEHILFAESNKKIAFAYEPILSYLSTAIKTHRLSRKEIDKACGLQMSGHWFGRSQFIIPSQRNYDIINKLCKGSLKPYAQLKAEYIQLRDQTNYSRRPFNVNKHVPYTDVWDFKPVRWYEGKHPCEKPLDLMEHIIKTSSLKGGLVLDSFAGSGSTALACINTERRFIGCELGQAEFEMAIARLNLISKKIDP